MTVHKTKITKDNLPETGSLIAAGGKVYLAVHDAHFVDDYITEAMMTDEDLHWIRFYVPDEDDVSTTDDVIYFEDILLCECLYEGRPILVFWEGNWNATEQEKGRMPKQIPTEERWSVFT